MRTGGPPQHYAVANHRIRKAMTCATPNNHYYRRYFIRVIVMPVSGVPLIYVMTVWEEKLASSRAISGSSRSQDLVGSDWAKAQVYMHRVSIGI